MKIRIRGQSVRLRLGRSEVAALGRGEAVEEIVHLGPAARFGCALRPQAGGDGITHTYVDGLLSFQVPASRASQWANTDEVGFSQELPLGDGRTLRLLVEKDFVCLDNGTEPQDDAFPNPSAAC